jgi:hypothetical protein
MKRPDSKPVGDGTLQEVVQVEQQIMAMLDAESARANAWRERRRREIDEAHQSEIVGLERQRARQRDAAARDAADTAAEVLRQARAEAGRIEGLSDAWLEDIVWRHVAHILPGREA